MVAESVYDRASDRLVRVVTDPEALADPDHRPANPGTSPEKVAVVMDIDQTILDDSPYVARLVSWGGWHDQSAEDAWGDWCRQSAAAAVPGAVGFVAAVRELDQRLPEVELRLFLITNRHVSLEDATVENLRSVGIEIDPELVLCLEEREDWDRDKARRRAYIAALGYRMAMVVGDDLNDLRPARELGVQERLAAGRQHHDFAARGLWVMVPNPLFGSWLRAAAAGGDAAVPLSHRLGHRLDPRWPGE
jgi:5'-nucleotidase (lipoprotein e(P4) family)